MTGWLVGWFGRVGWGAAPRSTRACAAASGPTAHAPLGRRPAPRRSQRAGGRRVCAERRAVGAPVRGCRAQRPTRSRAPCGGSSGGAPRSARPRGWRRPGGAARGRAEPAGGARRDRGGTLPAEEASLLLLGGEGLSSSLRNALRDGIDVALTPRQLRQADAHRELARLRSRRRWSRRGEASSRRDLRPIVRAHRRHHDELPARLYRVVRRRRPRHGLEGGPPSTRLLAVDVNSTLQLCEPFASRLGELHRLWRRERDGRTSLARGRRWQRLPARQRLDAVYHVARLERVVGGRRAKKEKRRRFYFNFANLNLKQQALCQLPPHPQTPQSP